MRVLITGSSGFLGRHLLKNIPGDKVTLGRGESDIIVDLQRGVPDLSGHFDIVVHAAGRAHFVPRTDAEKQEFFDVNVTGTKNLLIGLERLSTSLKSFIFVSSVAVYGISTGQSIDENNPLAATDAYGKSKIEAEQVVQAWCDRHGVICTILRLPLLAGPNPPGNLGSMINGIKRGYYCNIASGKARKSVVLAEDVAKIIPIVASIGGNYNLTDGYHPSFLELSELIARQLGIGKPANIPNWMATIMSKGGDILGSKAPINSDKLQKITSDLTFDDSKGRKLLGWNPTPVLEGFKIK